MNKAFQFGFVILMALAAVCVIPTSATASDGSFDRTLNVSGTLSLDVSTGSGSIDIRHGSGNKVEIHGRIRVGANWFRSTRDSEDVVRSLESNPPIEQSGQTVRIGRIADRDAERNVSISYEIVVPEQSNVRSHTGSGSQTIDGIIGQVEVGTGSGSVTIRDIKGELNASTGSGSIHATGIRGSLRMQTGSGGINVQGEQTSRWDLQTGSGGIDINLPPNAAFELSAHTGSGGVNVGFPMTVQGRIDRNRHEVSGKVGSGGPVLNARTGSGHIRIQ